MGGEQRLVREVAPCRLVELLDVHDCRPSHDRLLQTAFGDLDLSAFCAAYRADGDGRAA